MKDPEGDEKGHWGRVKGVERGMYNRRVQVGSRGLSTLDVDRRKGDEGVEEGPTMVGWGGVGGCCRFLQRTRFDKKNTRSTWETLYPDPDADRLFGPLELNFSQSGGSFDLLFLPLGTLFPRLPSPRVTPGVRSSPDRDGESLPREGIVPVFNTLISTWVITTEEPSSTRSSSTP